MQKVNKNLSTIKEENSELEIKHMSSKMTGLFRKLTWADFKCSPPASNPDDMQAEAHPNFSATGVTTKPVGKGADQMWQMGDTITVAITFNSAESWKLKSVASESKQEQDRLLKHEQGHYDLTALLARDMFLELMQLKELTFSTSGEIGAEVRKIHSHYDGKAQPLQNKYDSFVQTDHGRSQPKQTQWDGFINTAFTQPRFPAKLTPGGTVYKIEILEVLKKNGINVP